MIRRAATVVFVLAALGCFAYARYTAWFDRRFECLLGLLAFATLAVVSGRDGRLAARAWVPGALLAGSIYLAVRSSEPDFGFGVFPAWLFGLTLGVLVFAPLAVRRINGFEVAAAIVRLACAVPAALYVAEPRLIAANFLHLASPQSALLAVGSSATLTALIPTPKTKLSSLLGATFSLLAIYTTAHLWTT